MLKQGADEQGEERLRMRERQHGEPVTKNKLVRNRTHTANQTMEGIVKLTKIFENQSRSTNGQLYN